MLVDHCLIWPKEDMNPFVVHSIVFGSREMLPLDAHVAGDVGLLPGCRIADAPRRIGNVRNPTERRAQNLNDGGKRHSVRDLSEGFKGEFRGI